VGSGVPVHLYINIYIYIYIYVCVCVCVTAGLKQGVVADHDGLAAAIAHKTCCVVLGSLRHGKLEPSQR
jgi:hypothetical protein